MTDKEHEALKRLYRDAGERVDVVVSVEDVHPQTAAALVRKGYLRVTADGVEVTREGAAKLAELRRVLSKESRELPHDRREL